MVKGAFVQCIPKNSRWRVIIARVCWQGPASITPRLQDSIFHKTEIPLLADDDVVQDTKVDRSSGFQEGAGEVLVFGGRLRIAAGVVVDEDDA